jgi:predicted DNA-binding transcriptional regulator AlpA
MEQAYIITKSQLDQLIEKIDLLLEKREIPKDQDKQWLNTKEATQLLGIGLTTLWTYRKQGKIKGRKIGHKLYFSSSELNNLLTNS